jgi:NADH-quinone oxidoreductase subunit I
MAIDTAPDETYRGNGRPRRGGGFPGLGLLKGLFVTLKTLLSRSVTQQYPHVKPDLPPRTRGVIALKPENCTVCWKCSRECPDWCIYIESHKETHQPASGGRARSAKVLDRFAIDYALCMYCGICVEVCPFDALFWSPEFEYATYGIAELTHEKEKLEEWTYTVLPPPELEEGAKPAAETAESHPEPPTSATPIAAPGAESASGPPARVSAASASPSVARGAPSGETSAAGAQAAEASSEATPLVAEGGADAPAAVSAAAEAEHVEPDQETHDRVLQEELDKGTDRRVAEGRAKAAAIRAARRKAQEGGG